MEDAPRAEEHHLEPLRVGCVARGELLVCVAHGQQKELRIVVCAVRRVLVGKCRPRHIHEGEVCARGGVEGRVEDCYAQDAARRAAAARMGPGGVGRVDEFEGSASGAHAFNQGCECSHTWERVQRGAGTAMASTDMDGFQVCELADASSGQLQWQRWRRG